MMSGAHLFNLIPEISTATEPMGAEWIHGHAILTLLIGERRPRGDHVNQKYLQAGACGAQWHPDCDKKHLPKGNGKTSNMI